MEFNHTMNESSIENCELRTEITELQWLLYYVYVWWVEGFGSVFTGVIGIFFNIITIGVLLGSELSASFFNWLLVSLSVFDAMFLLGGILEAFRSHIGSSSFHNLVFVEFLYPFRGAVMCCSIYITVALALERYNALLHPVMNNVVGTKPTSKRRQMLINNFHLHRSRLLKYIGPILVLSIAFYIPKRLELEIRSENKTCTNSSNVEDCGIEYTIELTDLRTNNHYNLWYLNVATLLITAVIPLVMLTYLNVNVYLKLKEYVARQPLTKSAATSTLQDTHVQKAAKKREKDMVQKTRILFSIVFLFVLFHVLRVILNIEEFVTLDNQRIAKEMGCEWLQYWTIIAAPLSHLLLQINSSINFFIYCFFNKSFRNELVSWTSVLINFCRTKREFRESMSTENNLCTIPLTLDHKINNNVEECHNHENEGQKNNMA